MSVNAKSLNTTSDMLLSDSEKIDLKEQLADSSEDEIDHDELEALSLWLPSTLFFVPDPYEVHLVDGQVRMYQLTFWQKAYLVLDEAKSCQLANIYSKAMLCIIILSILAVVGSTVDHFQHTPDTCSNPACDNDSVLCPGYQICAPVANAVFYYLDLSIVILFTVDYSFRLALVSYMPPRLSGTISDDWDFEEAAAAKAKGREPLKDPVQTPREQLWRFLFSLTSFIDIAAVLPSLIILSLHINSSSTSFIRIFRMFRIFKMSKQFMAVIGVFRNALVRSKDAIIILSFSLVVAVIVLGCIEYSVESGKFVVNSDYPTGAFINDLPDDQTRISPYTSIPVSMYWAMITLSTIGYGDIYPVTPYGRGIACLAACLGIIVIALPVTVLGTNFSNEYEIYSQRQKDMRERRKKIRIKKALQSRRASNFSRASANSQSFSSENKADLSANPTVTALTQSIIGAKELGNIRKEEILSPMAPIPGIASQDIELSEILRKQSDDIRFLLTNNMANCSQKDLLEHYRSLRDAHERLLIGVEKIKINLEALSKIQ